MIYINSSTGEVKIIPNPINSRIGKEKEVENK